MHREGEAGVLATAKMCLVFLALCCLKLGLVEIMSSLGYINVLSRHCTVHREGKAGVLATAKMFVKELLCLDFLTLRCLKLGLDVEITISTLS